MIRNLLCLLIALVLGLMGCTQGSQAAPPAPQPLLGGELLLAERVGEPVHGDIVGDRLLDLRTRAMEANSGVSTSDQNIIKFLVDVVWSTAKQTAQGNIYWVTTEKVHYTTTDDKGREIRVSGLAFIPWNAGVVRAPILCLQHGTQIYREYAPSRFLYDMWKYIENPQQISIWAEDVVGYMYAHAGYIVVMADYPSLGINRDYHPYMDPSIAHSVVDLHSAIRTRLVDNTWKNWTVWNGQTFLMGYSEGGYATMQAARRMQDRSMTVSAVAPLDGPYDLSTTMRQVMIADQPSRAPYFLPYTLNSFQKIKGDATYAFTKTLLPTYAGSLPPLLDGGHKGDEVSAAMPKRSDGLWYPRDILLPAFLTELSKPYTGNATVDGTVVTDLAAADAYRGWTPKMPLRLFHCETDELVPYGNSRAALSAWIQVPNVTGIQAVTPLDLGDSPVHVKAALPALLDGFLWIDTHKTR